MCTGMLLRRYWRESSQSPGACRHTNRRGEGAMDQKKWDGAFYLAGYAVECALKACIAKQTSEHDFPPTRNYSMDCYTHDLEKLISLAGLRVIWSADTNTDADLKLNWDIVLDWNESSRYQRKTQAEAQWLYNSI